MHRKKVYIKGKVKIGKQVSGLIWQRRSTLSIIFSTLAFVWFGAAIAAAGLPIIPMIWYKIQPDTSQALAQVLRRPVTSFEDALVEEGVKEAEPWQPPVDESLPGGHWLMIEKIGVDTPILEAPVEEHEEVFRQGVWRVPDFGTAYERELPMILAAHRFGYLSWTNEYRFKNSFYKLPQLEEGDEVKVIWDKREYVYEVYEAGESEEITNYTADLILYTCKFLESDVRIFVYARLIER
jgi:sortase (surface protein transpeptidase)